ncbi:MAG TPA: VWA domain-containing protein [Acidimicrobiales bacterium]|nr:VWA domain-containing protein [Acidimicrobiales bacterium]
MSFTWPAGLLLVLAVPIVLAIYVLAARRRRQAISYSSLALLRKATPRRSRWRRHVPVALLLTSLAVLAVASARPELTSNVPVGKTTIILALDESGSMCLSDVLPDRLAVAQSAAREFVGSQPKGVQMGLVLFAGFAELAVPPTTDRSALDNALNDLSTGPGTAIGAAVLKALDAISEVDPQVQPVGNVVSSAAAAPSSPTAGQGTSGSSDNTGSGATPGPGKQGYVPDIIVLLTDGENNRGITPLQAAPYAVARRVRVYTIGFGTTHMAPFKCTPQQQGGFAPNGGFGPTGGFGGGGYGGGPYGGGPFGGGFAGLGGRSPLVADLPPLRELSRLTGGASFSAQDASELKKVFANLPKHVAVEKQRHEVTATFGLIGALLALAAFGSSLRWSPYP